MVLWINNYFLPLFCCWKNSEGKELPGMQSHARDAIPL